MCGKNFADVDICVYYGILSGNCYDKPLEAKVCRKRDDFSKIVNAEIKANKLLTLSNKLITPSFEESPLCNYEPRTSEVT